jgi:hypothetical protein
MLNLLMARGGRICGIMDRLVGHSFGALQHSTVGAQGTPVIWASPRHS